MLSGLLVLTMVAATPGVSAADPAPASTPSGAAALAGGWLARQVDAEGAAAGTLLVEDVRPTAWLVLGLLATGQGRSSTLRASEGMVRVADERGLGDLHVEELALMVLVFTAVGGDASDVGEQRLDLLAELRGRRQQGGVDDGMYGADAPLGDPVHAHALALLALASAGEEVPAESITWLAGQQCPDGGWPPYRDAASRSTGTCELQPSAMAPTAMAAMAAAAVGLHLQVPPEQFLRATATESGGFASAPGLAATPVATALGILALRAVTGQEPDASWAGRVGTPTQVLLTEQLGCGWHGADRGAVPPRALDTAEPGSDGGATEATPSPGGARGSDGAPPPPGAAAPVRDVAVAALALSGRLLPLRVGAPAVGDPFPHCPVTTARVAAEDRVGTAVALSREAFPDGAPAVVVATARGYPDALAATAVAGALGGPVLLSEPTWVPPALREEVERLQASEVVLMGGTGALGEAVAAELAAVDGVSTVRRIAGPTRVDTAAAAAEEVGGDRAFVVRGSGPEDAAPWADAVSVGAWAATRRIPVLLTDVDALPEATAAALRGRGDAVVVGGTAAVSEAVAAQVGELVQRTRRIAGPTRVATSAAVLGAAFADGVDARTVLLATSRAYPDALAAGPAAAALGGTVALVDPARGLADPAMRSALLDVDYLVDRIVLVGGPAGLSHTVAEDAAGLVREGADG